MNCIMYRTFVWSIDLPDDFAHDDDDELDVEKVVEYLGENDRWPGFSDGEEVRDEMQVIRTS